MQKRQKERHKLTRSGKFVPKKTGLASHTKTHTLPDERMQVKVKKQEQKRTGRCRAGLSAAAVLTAALMVLSLGGCTQDEEPASSENTSRTGENTTPGETPGTTSAPSSAAATTTTTAAPTTTKAPYTGDGHYIQPRGGEWSLILVNDWNAMPEDYESTVTLVDYRGDHQFDSRMVEQLDAMMRAGSSFGLWPVSAYRPYSLQEKLYNQEVAEWKAAGYSQEEAEIKAATVVKRPGTSEHNTGLALDLLGSGYATLTEGFADTEAYAWLQEHCADYGFILRFPKGKEDITGVIYEPWHYRYVGVEHAKEIMSRGLCLEEYLAEKGL